MSSDERIKVGKPVAVRDYQGETFGATILRIIDDENIIVRGCGLDTSAKYHGMIIPVTRSQVRAAV